MSAELIAVSRKDAAEAAGRAGVRIETVHDFEQLRTVCDVIDAVWRPAPDDRPITFGVLRAMTHAGNYCTLAWSGQEPVGVCVAFLGLGTHLTLHSHIAAVLPAAAGRNIGRALKLDQRAWALERRVREVTWTYDPLVRRNAYFNATRLGALPKAYLVDFYGDMNDAINAGQRTDRLAVSWLLEDPGVGEICAGRVTPALSSPVDDLGVLLDVDPRTGEPVRHPDRAGSGQRLVRVPDDIESMRVAQPDLALRWRLAVRDVLGGLMTDGWRITSVGRSGYYVLHPRTGAQAPAPAAHPTTKGS